MIDLHSHVLLHPYNETTWDDQVIKEPVAYRIMLAGRHAAATLQAGFTTLRDLGTEGADYADVGIKRAIDEGVAPGPRLLVATKAIVASYSYGTAEKSYRPDMEIPYGAQPATGIDEVTKAVREQSARGADWIKIYGDYRTGIDGTARPTFTMEEMKAMVAATHITGRKVAVHASSDDAIRMAVLAGADTIEHGYGASEATFRRRRKRPANTSRSTCAAARRRQRCSRRTRRSRWRASSGSRSATAATWACSRTGPMRASWNGWSSWGVRGASGASDTDGGDALGGRGGGGWRSDQGYRGGSQGRIRHERRRGVQAPMTANGGRHTFQKYHPIQDQDIPKQDIRPADIHNR